MISPGTKVVYYKGKLRKSGFAPLRLSPEPHYFGIAEIGKIYPDKNSDKGDYFAVIEHFQPFSSAILSKTNDGYLEPIPASKVSNYWRDGTRAITEETYNKIVISAKLADPKAQSEVQPEVLNDISQEFESLEDGHPSMRYTTVYERNPKLRQQAILIHGTTCFGCGFNFKQFYGDYADGFIHIHHVKPVSKFGGSMAVDPEIDLVPLCANCHSVVHRKKDSVLSVTDLKKMISKQ